MFCKLISSVNGVMQQKFSQSADEFPSRQTKAADICKSLSVITESKNLSTSLNIHKILMPLLMCLSNRQRKPNWTAMVATDTFFLNHIYSLTLLCFLCLIFNKIYLKLANKVNTITIYPYYNSWILKFENTKNGCIYSPYFQHGYMNGP